MTGECSLDRVTPEVAAALNGGYVEADPIQSDGPAQFDAAAAAQNIRDEITAIPGNEHAFEGIDPSTVMVDLNDSDMTLTGSVPSDVVAALFAGQIPAGLPESYKNPTFEPAQG